MRKCLNAGLMSSPAVDTEAHAWGLEQQGLEQRGPLGSLQFVFSLGVG